MQDYKKLTVWRRAHELTLEVYRLTSGARSREYPGLAAQLRGAAASVAADVVEGCGHGSQPELARFLQMASASAIDVGYHLLLARDLGAIEHIAYARLEAKTTQVQQLLGGLLRRVRKDLDGAPAQTPRRIQRTRNTRNA